MITICLPSRRNGNLSSNLERFINNIDSICSEKEKEKIEIIIKFDSDDSIPDFIKTNNFLFPIKYVQYNRCEGRWDYHSFLNYLITLRNDKSKCCINMADDFIIRKPFVDKILQIFEEKPFSIVGGAWSDWGGDFTNLNINAPYQNRYAWEKFIGAYCPIVGEKILKSVISFGLSPSVDAWAVALALVTYQNYGVNIWQDLECFYYRDEAYDKGNLIGTTPEHHKAIKPYNTLDMMNFRNSYNQKFWEIVNCQAKNIVLNMKDEKAI